MNKIVEQQGKVQVPTWIDIDWQWIYEYDNKWQIICYVSNR